MTNLKIKIEGQASFADKAQVDKEIQELSRWLALSPSLRVPKKKNGKEGSDTSSSSSSSSSSDDEKSKKMPPDCKICHKEFGKVFKKPVTIYTLLSSPILSSPLLSSSLLFSSSLGFSLYSLLIEIFTLVALLPLPHLRLRVVQ